MKTYKVQKNDTLWGISKRFLGDGNRYREIMKVNGMTDTVIHPNMVLEIPSELDYEAIGRACVQAMNDVDNLNSVEKLFNLLEK